MYQVFFNNFLNMKLNVTSFKTILVNESESFKREVYILFTIEHSYQFIEELVVSCFIREKNLE